MVRYISETYSVVMLHLLLRGHFQTKQLYNDQCDEFVHSKWTHLNPTRNMCLECFHVSHAQNF